MTTSLQTKQDIETRVAGWVKTYADTITENYRRYHVETLEGNLSGKYPEYARKQLDEIENGTANLMKFKVKTGKKYYKIVQMNYEKFWKNGIIKESDNVYGYREGSVHAFVDKKIKGQVLAYDYEKDFASVYNWLDQKFIETKLSNLVETPL